MLSINASRQPHDMRIHSWIYIFNHTCILVSKSALMSVLWSSFFLIRMKVACYSPRCQEIGSPLLSHILYAFRAITSLCFSDKYLQKLYLVLFIFISSQKEHVQLYWSAEYSILSHTCIHNYTMDTFWMHTTHNKNPNKKYTDCKQNEHMDTTFKQKCTKEDYSLKEQEQQQYTCIWLSHVPSFWHNFECRLLVLSRAVAKLRLVILCFWFRDWPYLFLSIPRTS